MMVFLHNDIDYLIEKATDTMVGFLKRVYSILKSVCRLQCSILIVLENYNLGNGDDGHAELREVSWL